MSSRSKTVRFQDPGEGIHEAEVVEVLVSAGDEVKEGQPILVVETDKADFEVHAPFSGVVGEVKVATGDTIEVGRPLLTIGSAGGRRDRGAGEEQEEEREAPEERGGGEDSRERGQARGEARETRDEAHETREEAREDETERREGDPAAVLERAEAEAGEAATAETRGEAEARPTRETRSETEPRPQREERAEAPSPASPATRRIARELGVALGEVQGTGEDGRILAQDVRAHAAGARRAVTGAEEAPGRSEPPLPDFSRFGPVERVPLRSVRRTIARRMAHAWESIPHVTHVDTADISELEAFRQRQSERLEASGAQPLTLTVLVMKAVAAVLGEFPRFNASLDPRAEELVYKHYCHVGVAVDTDRGLLVPTVRDVDRKSVRELGQELHEISQRARSGKLSRDEMAGGTFTITNVGAIGGVHFSPIINHPQVAILGLARARHEVRVMGDASATSPELAPRLVLPLCFAFDHRVNDGADAARFTRRLGEILADPEWFAVSI